MSKDPASLSVLTASRLGDGHAVFLNFDGVWIEGTEGALVARTPDEARALKTRGAHDVARNLVIEPYLLEVCEVDGRLIPMRHRERAQVSGPSIKIRADESVPSPRVRELCETDGRIGV